MIVVRSINELDLPRHGVVGLVPTMGALHAGHTALFRAARADSDGAGATRVRLDLVDESRDGVQSPSVVGDRSNTASGSEDPVAVQPNSFGLCAAHIDADLHRSISGHHDRRVVAGTDIGLHHTTSGASDHTW